MIWLSGKHLLLFLYLSLRRPLCPKALINVILHQLTIRRDHYATGTTTNWAQNSGI